MVTQLPKLHRHATALIIGGLCLLLAATGYNFIQLRQLSRLPTTAPAAIENIDGQLNAASLAIAQNTAENQRLSDQLAAASRQYQQNLAALTSDLSQSVQATEQQFDAINSNLAAHDATLKQLNDAVHQLQTVRAAANKPEPAALPPATSQKAASRQPLVTKAKRPFTLTAIELRGGGLVAVVAPNAFQRLDQLSHLAVGQQWQEWRLTDLSAQSATFQRGKQKVTVPPGQRGLSQ